MAHKKVSITIEDQFGVKTHELAEASVHEQMNIVEVKPKGDNRQYYVHGMTLLINGQTAAMLESNKKYMADDLGEQPKLSMAVTTQQILDSLRKYGFGGNNDRKTGKTTALLIRAKELSDAGHKVTVLCNHPSYHIRELKELFIGALTSIDYTRAENTIRFTYQYGNLIGDSGYLLIDEPMRFGFTKEQGIQLHRQFAVEYVGPWEKGFDITSVLERSSSIPMGSSSYESSKHVEKQKNLGDQPVYRITQDSLRNSTVEKELNEIVGRLRNGETTVYRQFTLTDFDGLAFHDVKPQTVIETADANEEQITQAVKKVMVETHKQVVQDSLKAQKEANLRKPPSARS